MKAHLALAGLLAAMAASTAHAQTGLRADVHVGWGPAVGAPADRCRDQRRGPPGSARTGSSMAGEIGYDFTLGKARLGVYSGLEGATAKRCSEVFAEVETCERGGAQFPPSARRAGYKVADRVLVYAKGGYSNGAFDLKLIDQCREQDRDLHRGYGRLSCRRRHPGRAVRPEPTPRSNMSTPTTRTMPSRKAPPRSGAASAAIMSCSAWVSPSERAGRPGVFSGRPPCLIPAMHEAGRRPVGGGELAMAETQPAPDAALCANSRCWRRGAHDIRKSWAVTGILLSLPQHGKAGQS